MEKALRTPKFAAAIAAVAIMLFLICMPAKAEAASWVDLNKCTVELSEDWWINYDREKGPDPNDIIVKNYDGTIVSKDRYDLELSGYYCWTTLGEFDVRATVTGHGDYDAYGKKSVYLEKDLIPISEATITLSQSSYEYTGKPCKPAVTATYKGKTLSDKNYSLEYYDNIDPTREAHVRIEGEGAFYGKRYPENYTIRLNLSKCTLKISPSEYVCKEPNNGIPEVTPEHIQVITSTGKAIDAYDTHHSYLQYHDGLGFINDDLGFKGSFKNNVHAGTASVSVNGQEGSLYYGQVTGTFTIKPRKVTSCQTPSDLVYTGRNLKLSIWNCSNANWLIYGGGIKEGRDYTIKYSRIPKAVGAYTATITFKGDYSGTFKKKFKILPGPPSINLKRVKATKTQVKASWKKVKGATGYKVYRWNEKEGKYTLYKTTKSTSCVIKPNKKIDCQVVKYIVKAYTKTGGKTYTGGYEGYCSCRLKPSKPAFSVKSSGYGKVIVKLKNGGQYQVQVSSNNRFVGGYYHDYFKSQIERSKVFYFSGVDSPEIDSPDKYYVRCRWYICDEDGNPILVGPWSATKTCKAY